MGLIREPEGIDFIIQSNPSQKQEKELSEYISNRKLEIKKKSKKATTSNQVNKP